MTKSHKCQRFGCSKRVNDRHRFCPSCRRQSALASAEARGRWEALKPGATGDVLLPLINDLLVLCHPDLHQGPKRHALAAEVTRQLLELRTDL